MTEGPRPRVRITHPRTEAVRPGPGRPAVREIDELTQLGDVYISSLIRSQRRLAIAVCAAVGLLLGGTAVLGAVSSRYATIRVFGLALPWVVLGLLVYPVLIGLGWLAVRSAERTERAFLELVRRR